VNKAIALELNATEIHLRKAWSSPEAYYRKKYGGWNRFKMYADWLKFRFFDFIWGNGESIIKLLGAVFVVLVIMTLYDAISFGNPTIISAYWTSFCKMPGVFLGILQPENYSYNYLAIVLIIRLVTFSFFISIIIKKYSRR
jgi:hypothetical protein